MKYEIVRFLHSTPVGWRPHHSLVTRQFTLLNAGYFPVDDTPLRGKTRAAVGRAVLRCYDTSRNAASSVSAADRCMSGVVWLERLSVIAIPGTVRKPFTGGEGFGEKVTARGLTGL
jgi:hypothetical protein